MLDMEAIKNFSIDKSGWKKVKFGDVVFEPKESVKDPVSEGIEHVVGLEHIDSEDIQLRRSESIEESTTFTKRFSIGDMLFGRRRAYLKKAAKADFDGICSGDITVMRARREFLLPELLPFIINNDNFFDYAITHSAGGLSPRVKFKDLSKYEFLLPDLVTQKALSQSLHSSIEIVTKQRELKEKLLLLNKTLVKEIKDRFQGKMISFEDSGLEVIDGDRGKNYPKSNDFLNINKGYCLFLNAGNVTKIGFDFSELQFISKEKDETLRKGKLRRNDLVITTRGTVGNSALYDSRVEFQNLRINSGMVIIRCEKSKADAQFIYLLLQGGFFDSVISKMAYGSAQPQLSVSIIKNLKFPILNQSENDRVVKKLQRIIDSKIFLEKKTCDSQQLIKTILSKVF